MGRRNTQGRSGPSTDPSTDKAHNSVTETFESTDEWAGGQVERSPWFHKRLNELESIFKLKLLCISAAVSIPSKGQVAVFSAEHAKEHLEGKNQGTIQAPNMRSRETMSTPTTAPQTTTAASPAHGGYPGTPIPPTAAPTTTYASTVTTGRVTSLLEQELGAHASGYLLAPLTIEEADEELLLHFLSTINNDRLAKIWRKKAKGSGRRFIVLMTQEIRDEEMSMTGENTIQAKIDTIVKTGLSEATMHNLYYMMEVYEEWADALPADAQVTEAKKAYIYQKWVCDLSASIKMQMQLNLASLEAKAAAKGTDYRATDPIGLVTKAANIVLSDEANEQVIKSIETGHAFYSGKYDPRKRPPGPPPGGGGGGGTSGGDTPKVWIAGMRLCAMCPQGTSDKNREHMDKSCRHATPEKLAEHAALLASKRAARKAEWDKAKTSGGGAKLATGAIDDADEAFSNSIFEGGKPTQVDLAELVNTGADARSLMARANTLSEAATTAATSTAAPSTSGSLAAGGATNIYVIGNSGDDTEDSISAGIYVGSWSATVVPFVNTTYLDHQMSLDPKALKARTKVATGLESAVARCERLDVVPIYMGPVELDGLGIGDNVGTYLLKAAGEDADSGSEPDACTSSDESEEDEPDADAAPVRAAADAADLFDHRPPTQPPSRATKFDRDLGSVAGSSAAAPVVGTPPPTTTDSLSPGERLDILTRTIEGVDINTHLDVLRGIIRDNDLPVSPATGGSEARTKYEMINEMRDIVGSSHLPLEVLLRRRSRPTPVPPPPMGIRVDARSGARMQHLPPHPLCNERGVDRATERELDFAEATRPSLLWRFCTLMPFIVFMHVLMGMLAQHPGVSGLLECRNFAPEWTCTYLGYVNTNSTLALPGTATATTVFAVEPGAFPMLQVPHGPRHGGVDYPWALILPVLVCALLALHMTLSTVVHAASRLAPNSRAWVARQDPLRATSPPSSRDIRRRPRRYGTNDPWTSSSYFVSSLGEAPPWLSLCILAIEIGASVVPRLAALSVHVLAIHVFRGILTAFRGLLGSYAMTPVRMLLRFALNFITAIVYIVLTVAVGTFTSERPYVSAADLRMCPYEHSTFSESRSSYFRIVAVMLCASARSTVRAACNGLFGCGGAVSDKLSSRAPAETDPRCPDYANTDAPRALHAFNPMRIAGKRAKQLHSESDKVKLDSKRSTRRRTLPVPKIQHGHALLGAKQKKVSFPGAKPTTKVNFSTLVCWSVIDSGCSWHCHPKASDLINGRRCNDTMTGIDGKPQKVTCIGDLPAMTRDHLGVWRRIVIRNVRCVPTFSDTLISVDQFWEDSQVDTIFNSVRCLAVPGKGDDPPLDIPFERKDKLYTWAFIPSNRHPSLQNAQPTNSHAFKATIHRPNSTSFFGALPPNEALELLSRRLHVGHGTIKKLGSLSQDIPANISKAHIADCEFQKVANATRVPLPGKAYTPSHVGRLIHGDIAGPFKRSQHGFLYFLVLVDDHSRFKQVFFLKKKSEALSRVKTFVAKLNAICNIGKPEAERVRIVGQLQLENAGEFLSREFTEYLEDESIARTTCPPHVHQLNGVAERAIRSVMEIVRTTREASACPIGFWPHLVEHAVDVLNRVTGPPSDSAHDSKSAFEVVTGQKPKILNIMPIGC